MRFALTRLLTLGLAVLAAHVLGFGYALVARQVQAAQTHPARVAGWLAPLSTLGLALPSFYVGALVLAGLLSYVLADPQAASPLPLSGFGWDAHLVLPVLALSLRPTAQVAQFTATLLAGEFRQ